MELIPQSFDVILWDMDGTIIDFRPAERAAITRTMALYGLPEATKAMVQRYHDINQDYWHRLELGQVTKQQVMINRFQDFFAEFGLPMPDCVKFNDSYQYELGQTVCFFDNAYEIITGLQGKLKQYCVTNGAIIAQEQKLKNTRLGPVFDDVFISDRIGHQKPSQEYFDYVRAHIIPAPLDRILIIGDSLTSDILGGNRLGCKTCWFDNSGEKQEIPAHIHVDYRITELKELVEIL